MAPDTVNPRLWRQARRNAQHGLFEVVPDAIWQVRGYDLSVMTIIRGSTGLIIVDPLTSEESAAAGLALLRDRIGNLPVKAVLFSHSHADHFGGVGGVISRQQVESGEVRVIAPHGFAREAVSENVLAGAAMNRRAEYMFGMRLSASPTGQVDTGLGPRVAGGTTGYMNPTETVGEEGATLEIDGLTFEFIDAAETEAPAEFLFYIPRYRTLHTTEVATKTFHNFLTLRGAQVRDALRWSQVIDAALQRWGHQADLAIASHGWPTFGGDQVRSYLAGHRDMYRFVHDRTLGAANMGATIQELPAALETVSNLPIDPSVRGYYGTVNHNAKAVYQRYFGWWDGVPANYDPLPPEEQARGYVALAGGPVRLLEAARQAQSAGNYRWAAELANHLVFADSDNIEAKHLLADAYEQLGFQAESGAWRNYYLGAAATLRGEEANNLPMRSQSADYFAAIPTIDLFNAMATRLASNDVPVTPQTFRFVFTDTQETVTVERRGVVEIPRLGADERPATATVRMTRLAFGAMLMGRLRMADLAAAGQVQLEGDIAALQAWMASHRPPNPAFNVVTP
ncbi:alkyl/aryl-sulfatase [Sphingomonas lacunae]|uniref:alkyl/aryl-sulfatase n=1 Tax=Sphingomonas lacunae TaxID=2698828 RepID=UPI001FEC97D3|nr:alkyl sulfatase dimerization domain-containing protein [Sphingomonas lacunae]